MKQPTRNLILGAALATALAAGAAPKAQAEAGLAPLILIQDESESEAERRIQQGLQAILDGLGLFMRDIPRYEAPEVMPNGDIILRRINPPKDAPGGQPDWKEDETPFSKPDTSETGGKGKAI